MKRRAPAASRNREPITQVLADELPATGLVLEIASGTGEHVIHFAHAFPALEWQPTDADDAALASIDAWRTDAVAGHGAGNVRPPLRLDAGAETWPPLPPIAAIVCINLVHISPRDTTEGLFRAASRLLPAGAPLIVYGPFFEDTPTSPSNIAFDADLLARDPRWGLRPVMWLDELGSAVRGLRRTRRIAMPANNLTLVYRRND